MAFDVATLVEPVSAEQPCGPDLDAAGDLEFQQQVARIEGLLPASFFKRDDEGRLQAFDRASIDFAAEFRQIEPLLEATRDLRLLSLYGRLHALNRDLDSFAATLSAIASLLSQYWEEVHPKADEGDYTLRIALLQSLDDMPTVVLPLQHMPLVESRRFGSISYRTFMVAAGEVQAREDEPPQDRATLDRALGEADLDGLKGTREHMAAVRDACGLIQVTSIEKAGYEQAVRLDRVSALATKILDVLDPVLAGRDPDAAPAASGADDGGASASAPPGAGAGVGGPVRPAGKIATVAQAAEALAAVSAYFRRSEPSSPSALLVGQATTLVGKSFVEVMRVLMPTRAEAATIAIGADRALELSFQQLTTVAEGLDGSSSWDSGESTDGADGAASEPILIESRGQAADWMRQVAQFYRVAEPASPIPLLLDRSCNLIDRDFLAILKDVLPAPPAS